MKIYVAAHCRWAASHIATLLRAEGHAVTSRWLDEPFHPTSAYDEAERQRIAQMDYNDVSEADALVLIAGPDKYSGGKFVETGIAVALGKRVVVLGRRENMLLYLPSIAAVSAPDELMKVLRD